MSKQQRVNAMVCVVCWYELRPTEYAPDTNTYAACVRCDALGPVYRVSWAEVRDKSSRNRPASHYIIN